ncbi:MAG: cyclophilin-like fold protein [Nitrospinota bacterium]
MRRRIQISAGEVSLPAALAGGPTADLLWEALPVTGKANTWGEEIYFPIPLQAPQEPGAREEMQVGEIAFWPPGGAFCIFFGPTPASAGEAPRAASPVNPLGRVEGDVRLFRAVRPGTEVRLERAP